MAKIFLDPAEKQLDILCKYIRGEMLSQNISLAEMGAELNVTSQSMGYKFKTKSFSAGELLKIFKKLKTDGNTIARLMA